MKKQVAILLSFLCLLAISSSVSAQTMGKLEIWKKNQVIEPSTLMALIKNKKAAKPPIYNIGFVSNIPGAVSVGSANTSKGLASLKNAVKGVSKTSTVVIYCGCCPFEHCPNVRPAYTLLKSLGYNNTLILNLPTSLKADWIDKGYPLAAK
ncbi:rhodanese-like domain-containing protein [Pedobacter sp.]|uniref:rhodanese-like domain-containing protein n=1 Tax=Pedobacter sp. TaxID=1411316 RepID=UPI003D7F7878